MLRITTLPVKEWKQYRDIRLDSLKRAEIALGGNYNKEKEFLPHHWQHLLLEATLKDSNFIPLFIKVDSRVIGIGAVKFTNTSKFDHISRLTAIYIKKSYRGKGIAHKLMNRLIKRAFSNRKIKKIKLIVNQQQIKAVGLYLRSGFRIVGELRNEFKVDNRYYDAYLMELERRKI